ncbi:hypothetical protein RHGRI_000703 [Rhododendron griersonianum]|uniref:Uncharacterized protein n=1 Tax=Rhododendron griersonianum TaxID=479676 RepID=A0AAV6LIT0_9ERIC|nr:hypothetical protein RHGRI_000703 [Rhododendron griersonianum]
MGTNRVINRNTNKGSLLERSLQVAQATYVTLLHLNSPCILNLQSTLFPTVGTVVTLVRTGSAETSEIEPKRTPKLACVQQNRGKKRPLGRKFILGAPKARPSGTLRLLITRAAQKIR